MNNVSEVTDLRRARVQRERNGTRYYYPKTIPRERESMTLTYVGVISLVFLMHIYLADDWNSFISVYMFTLLFYFFIVLTHRIILFIHEKKHSLSRYENDYGKMLKAAFTFNIQSILMFVFCMLYSVYYLASYGWPTFNKEFWMIIAILFSLHRILDLDSNPIFDSISIAKGNGLDYGAGMAYSMFYGYLNYILPKTGDQNKNLKELMQDYESTEKIKFEVHKIFILIPKSLSCPVDIADASKLMEQRESLPEKIITVAGVRNRVYKNSVYSIKHEKSDKMVYVCTEYATPLKTFKEVVKNATKHTEFYTRHRNDILLQFYLTLKQILEHEHMDDMCELVFYEDKDANNKYHDVGRILLDRLMEHKKSRRQ